MRRTDIPANISIMQLNEQRLSTMRPVTALDMFDGTNIHFHEDGLFSTSIFGRVGSEERDTRFSFIRLNTTILHPIVFETLVKLKGLYLGIMSGKAYAIWDEKEKDFVSADQITGKTGYHFFMSHWKDIKHKETGSDIRELRKKLVNKYLDVAETKYVLVIPAGLRDVQIDEGGRVREGEVNSFYRTLIAVSNSIGTGEKADSPIFDNSRFSLQNAFNKLYEHIYNLVEGKGGFIQRKWGSRRVFNGTRNVITAMDTSSPVLGAPNSPKHKNTVIGLYQLTRNCLPFTKHKLLSGWLSKLFNPTDNTAFLINPKSLKKEAIKVDSELIDRWTSSAGMEKMLNYFADPDNRLKPIVIKDFYVGLIYRPKDKPVFRIFGDIDEFPVDNDAFSHDDVHPLTYCELIYLSAYMEWNTKPTFITRYPVTGIGSIYPSYPYVKTTIVGEMRWELNESWERKGQEFVALEYPLFDRPVFLDTITPHPSRLAGLGGDFDGDTSSANSAYVDDSIVEVEEFFTKRKAYVNAEGNFHASPIVESVERALVAMTGDVE